MKFYYLLEIQYLGFRFHGWQKQSGIKTIQGVVETALLTILKSSPVLTLAGSRTDSMVSALQSFFMLICQEQLDELVLVEKLNLLLPQDIKILSAKEVSRDFKIISAAKMKEYFYFFSSGVKTHPFTAPFITHIFEELDIALMQKAAQLFIGRHNFKNYCYKPRANQKFEREIIHCELVKNDILTASFFPEESYLLKISSRSFMRHQVRLIMGALFKVGMNETCLEEIELSLKDPGESRPAFLAPASGLMLNKIIF